LRLLLRLSRGAADPRLNLVPKAHGASRREQAYPAAMDLGLRDKVAIVTGSSRGLGKAAAATLAAEGARVVLNGRSESALLETAEELRAAGGSVHAVVADVSSEAGCAQLVDQALKAFGRVDILINNAGGGTPAGLTASDDEWSKVIEWMFWPSLRLTRMVA